MGVVSLGTVKPVILFDSGERVDGERIVLVRYRNRSSGLTYLLSLNDSGGRFPALSEVGLDEYVRVLGRYRSELEAQRLRVLLQMMLRLHPDLMFEMSDVFWKQMSEHVGETVLDTRKIGDMLRAQHDSYSY